MDKERQGIYIICGSPCGSGSGDPENQVIYLKVTKITPTKWIATFTPAPGEGDCYFQIYNNAVFQRTLFCPEGVEQVIPIIPNSGALAVSVVAIKIGYSSLPGYDISQVARVFESEDANQATFQWNWTGEVFSTDDVDDNAVNFVLTHLERGNTTILQANRHWSYVTCNITVDTIANTAQVDILDASQSVVASGTSTRGSNVTISPITGGFVTGTCFVNPSAETKSGIVLMIRWPSKMNIKRDTVNPPVEIVDSVTFDGATTGKWIEPTQVVGTFYYAIQPLSETGEPGTQSPAQTATIKPTPDSPGNIHRVSGDASAVVLGFDPSDTPNAITNAYISLDGVVGQRIDVFNVAATVATGVDAITLPPFTGYPGRCYVLLRASLIPTGGNEEKNGDVFFLDFDNAGNFVGLPPNTPTIALGTIAISSGLNLSLRGSYYYFQEQGTATDLQLFSRTKTGSYDFTSPIATASLSNFAPNIKAATLNYTFPTGGPVYVCLKAVTADGVQGDASPEIEINPSLTQMPVADSILFNISRG